MSEPIANRYKPIEKLGSGAMGLVLLVEDATTGQRVALKQLSTDLNEQTLLKFKQEFRVMTQLTHPNCCKVFDFGLNPDGTPFYTMEVVPGHGLDEQRLNEWVERVMDFA